MKLKRRMVCAVCCAMLLGGCQSSNDAAETVIEEAYVPVETTSLSSQDIQTKLIYAGRINAAETLAVMSKMAGRVKEVYYDIGDAVEKGDVLFRLDEQDVENQIAQLEASLRQAEQGIVTAQNALNTVTGGQYESQLLQIESQLDGYDKQLANAEITLQNAQIAMDNAQNGLDNVTSTYENTKTLYDAGAISKNDYDKAELAYNQSLLAQESAKNSYEQAQIAYDQILTTIAKTQESYDLTTGTITDENKEKAQLGINQARASRDTVAVQLDIARQTRGDTAIIAPMGGIISAKTAKAGEFTSAQMPAFTIVKMDVVNVEVKVSELLINKLSVGQPVSVWINAIGKEPITGHIVSISPAADQTSTYPIKIEIDNAQGIFKPGMFAEVHFINNESKGTLVLPRNTVFQDESESFVFVNNNNVAQKVVVTTGIDNGDNIEILTGLAIGDEVITKGQDYVTDGDMLKIVEAQQ